MSSRILLDDERGPGQDTHPSAPPPPAEPQRPAEPLEAREPLPVEGGEPADQSPPAEEPVPKAAQDRIDRLTRERYEAQRERDQLRDEWRRFQQQQAQQVPPTPEERARQQGYQQRQQEELGRTFDQACNDLYVSGRQEYGAEMDDAVQALKAVGWGDRHDALAALTQLEGGHRVYRELARDLDRAARVLNLPPMAMAMELTRMAGGPSSAAPAPQSVPDSDAGGRVEVSRAPEPVRHIGGRSTQQERPLDHPQVSMAEFIRRRDREQRRSRIAR
jgi:hypothetical protein